MRITNYSRARWVVIQSRLRLLNEFSNELVSPVAAFSSWGTFRHREATRFAVWVTMGEVLEDIGVYDRVSLRSVVSRRRRQGR